MPHAGRYHIQLCARNRLRTNQRHVAVTAKQKSAMAKKKKSDNATPAGEPQNGATAPNATPAPPRTRAAGKAGSTKTKKPTRKTPAAKKTKKPATSAPGR